MFIWSSRTIPGARIPFVRSSATSLETRETKKKQPEPRSSSSKIPSKNPWSKPGALKMSSFKLCFGQPFPDNLDLSSEPG